MNATPPGGLRPSSTARLWFTPDRARFFLVPAEVVLPSGELAVRSLQATAHRFDEQALQGHEVDSATARVEKIGKALEQHAPELERTIEGAGQALADLLGVRSKRGKD